MHSPLLFVFVDGLGIGTQDQDRNPLFAGAYPTLQHLVHEAAIPVDACLGVDGIPQSATGQTSLLTGTNAPLAIGRHMEGLPDSRLKAIIRESNLLKTFADSGKRVTFANGYWIPGSWQDRLRKRQSVTTVATLSALGDVRREEAILCNQAVCHDLIREAIRERGYEGPEVKPADAAGHLAAIAREHDLTLFEFFQTDSVAHKGNAEEQATVLSRLETFFCTLLQHVQRDAVTLVLCSDHGNIEDNATRTHTMNPVPYTVIGPGRDSLLDQVEAITDVSPALVRYAGIPRT